MIGLTATPKDEIDKNTYEIFELENGVPTFGYDLAQAVKDGYLVDYVSVESKLKFIEQGIVYDELSEEDKRAYEETFEDEHGDLPDSIGSSALNTWIFNEDTIKQVLNILMTEGIKIDYGQKIGKTIIVKKYVLIMLAAAVLIPPFMLWRAPQYTGVLGFMLSVIFCVFMLLQYVSLKEYQFPKAATLLCAAPYSRRMIVLSKYIFCMATYVVCCLLYVIETLVIPGLGPCDIKLFVLMLFIISVFIGVYLPVQYKLGYEKTKFAFVVVIMASPFILPYLMKMENVNLDFLSLLSPVLAYGGIILLSLGILVVSIFLSMRFYSSVDLA